ncbi:MAG: Ger(x)C family spore germination protein [Oscillospiraceae bacterium]|nr:Ger(x)C family spore germination protein [Oscillospiraceae bacterium]
MQKIGILAAVILLLLFPLNGQETFKKDISMRLVVQGIGIDIEDDGSYTVTLQAINTNAQSVTFEGGDQEPVKTYNVTGDTIYTAVKSVTEMEGKTPLYSQNRVIIIGRDIAEKGLEGVIDFFVRDTGNCPSVDVAIADGKASEILEVKSESGEVIARNIEQSISSTDFEAEISRLQIYELVNRYEDKLPSFTMPILAAVKDGDKERVEIIETAVFSGSKLKGTLTKEETVMFNFLCNKVSSGAISYDTDDGKISMGVIDSKATRRVSLQNNTPVFTLSVNVEGDIAEIYNGTAKTVDRARLKELKNGAEEHLKSGMESVLKKLYTELGCDAPGLSRLIYSRHPSFFRENEKNLSTVMANSQYNVEVKVTIRRVGHELIKVAD